MRKIKGRWIMILARTLDHRIGKTDEEKPDLPVLTVEEAVISFYFRLFIVVLNILTCFAVIANVFRHW